MINKVLSAFQKKTYRQVSLPVEVEICIEKGLIIHRKRRSSLVYLVVVSRADLAL